VVVFIDQFDNAARMKGLGAGDSLKAARWRIRRMVAALAV
jgi:UDP:flavonoid glycosyltransferase YjiC (YdhE family)